MDGVSRYRLLVGGREIGAWPGIVDLLALAIETTHRRRVACIKECEAVTGL